MRSGAVFKRRKRLKIFQKCKILNDRDLQITQIGERNDLISVYNSAY